MERVQNIFMISITKRIIQFRQFFCENPDGQPIAGYMVDYQEEKIIFTADLGQASLNRNFTI